MKTLIGYRYQSITSIEVDYQIRYHDHYRCYSAYCRPEVVDQMGLWNWGKGTQFNQRTQTKYLAQVRLTTMYGLRYCDIMFMRKKLTETEKMDKHFNGTTYTKDGIDNDF